jgi:hypothetical protein
MVGACSAHGGDKKYEKALVGKSEGKRSIGKSRRGWIILNGS